MVKPTRSQHPRKSRQELAYEPIEQLDVLLLHAPAIGGQICTVFGMGRIRLTTLLKVAPLISRSATYCSTGRATMCKGPFT